MIININTSLRTLETWRQARTWCHVWWMTAIGGLDVGTLERSELMRLTRRFRARLMKALDIQGFQRYHGTDGHWHFTCQYRATPPDEHQKTIAVALERVNAILASPEKVSSWTEFAYGLHNVLMDGDTHAPPCMESPGVRKGAPTDETQGRRAE